MQELGQFSQYSVWLQTWRPGFNPRQRQRIFRLAFFRPDQLWGPPSLLSSVYRESIPGGKALPGRDPDYSLPSSVEDKN
jgi:hypothetical protein